MLIAYYIIALIYHQALSVGKSNSADFW